METVNRYVTPDDRRRTKSFIESSTQWAGRTLARTFFVEPYLEAHRKLEAQGAEHLTRRSLGASAFSLFFPLTEGIHQSSLGDKRFIGGVSHVAAFLTDLAFNGGLAVPLIGHGIRLGYHFLASGAAEILPDSKKIPSGRR